MRRYTLFNLLLIIGLAVLFSGRPTPAIAQGIGGQAALGTAFTYQGYLTDNGTPLDGQDQCDLQFGLWDAAAGGSQLGGNQTVLNVDFNAGYFTVELNSSGEFGANPFTGQARWLEIAVRCPAGSGVYTTLGREALTGTPYAHYSLSTQALQGQAIATTAPISGQVLKFDGSQWAPGSDETGIGGGDITGVAADTGLIGGGSSGEVSLAIAEPFRLPGSNCNLGQIAGWSVGTWTCGDRNNMSITGLNSSTTLSSTHQGLLLVSSNITITLPNTSSIKVGTVYTIKNIDTDGNTISISGALDGRLSRQLVKPYASLTVVKDRFSWHVIGEYVPPPMILYEEGGYSNGNISGRAGADALCNASINKPLGFANYRAFLSVDASDEIRDMPANYGVPTALDIAGPRGDLIAYDWADLLDGTIKWTTTLSNAQVTSSQWWSGSFADGSLAPNFNCNSWTYSGAGSGGVTGTANATNDGWLAGGNLPCGPGTAGRILCLAY